MKVTDILLENRIQFLTKQFGEKLFKCLGTAYNGNLDIFYGLTTEQIHEIYMFSSDEKLSILDAYMKYVGITKEQLIEHTVTVLASIDPTNNKQYLQWLILRFLAKEYGFEDVQVLRRDLATFHEKKNLLPTEKRDINKYTRETLIQLLVELEELDLKSNRQTKHDIKIQGAERIYDGKDCVILSLKTGEAATFYAANTRWCTSEPATFGSYLRQGPVYIFIPKDNPREKYQIHIETNQFKDPVDREVPEDKRIELYNKYPGFKKFIDSKINEINTSSHIPKHAVFDVKFYYPYIGGTWPEIENDMIHCKKNIPPTDVWEYVRYCKKKPWPEMEDVLEQAPALAADYAMHVLKRRWPEIEENLIRNITGTSNHIHIGNIEGYYNQFFVNHLAKFHNLRYSTWPALEKVTLGFLENPEYHKDGSYNNPNYVNTKLIKDYLMTGRSDKEWKEFEDSFFKGLIESTKNTELFSKYSEMLTGLIFVPRYADSPDTYFNPSRFNKHPWNRYEKEVLKPMYADIDKLSKQVISLKNSEKGIDENRLIKYVEKMVMFEVCVYTYEYTLKKYRIKFLYPELQQAGQEIKARRKYLFGLKMHSLSRLLTRDAEINKMLLEEPIFKV